MLKKLLLFAIFILFLAVPVYATTFTFNLSVNISDAVISAVTDGSGNPGKQISLPVSFSPVDLAFGDIIDLNLLFIGGDIGVFDTGAPFLGNDEKLGIWQTISSYYYHDEQHTYNFTNLTGIASTPLTFPTTSSIAFPFQSNITTSSFYFGGIDWDLTTTGSSSVSWWMGGLNSFTLELQADDIVVSHDPIPEPATMLLLGTGLIGLVGMRKRFNR